MHNVLDTFFNIKLVLTIVRTLICITNKFLVRWNSFSISTKPKMPNVSDKFSLYHKMSIYWKPLVSITEMPRI